MLFKILTGWETLISISSCTLHSTRSLKSQKCWPSWSKRGVPISSWVPRESSTSYSLCAENGQVLNIKESEGVWKGKDLGFHRAFGNLCFLDQSSSRGSGRSSSVPVIIDSPAWPRAYVLVRDGSGKEGRTWVGCSVSVLPWVVPTGPRVSFNRWEQIFRLPFSTWQLHRPFLQHVMARPHYIFLHFMLNSSQPRSPEHEECRPFTVTSPGHQQHHLCWIHTHSISKQRIWFYLIRLVYSVYRNYHILYL